MSNHKHNRYEKKAEKEHFLHQHNGLETKGHLKASLVETGKDLLIGVIGGGLVGAAFGKSSLLVGLGTTGAGYYTGNRLLSLIGIGMMASGGYQIKSSTSVSGINDMTMDGVKERLIAFKDTFAQKLFLDKFLKKSGAATMQGLGADVQYFNYNEVAGLEALENIEDAIENSAASRLQGGMGATISPESTQIEGYTETDALADLADISDINM